MDLPGGIEFREYRDEDAQGFLRLHDSRWRAIPPEFWRQWSGRPEVTASMALLDGEVVGQIPYHIREFVLRPGLAVPVAQEYSVIVAEEMRGRGIGSRLVAEAERFLADRCPVMMVYRGGERTPGYRFYQRTGHYDVAYHRLWVLGEGTPGEPPQVHCAEVDTLLAREAEVLEVFRSAYGSRGGFPRRRPGYYREALGSVIYCEAPGEFRFLYLEEAGKLIGYLLCLETEGKGARVLEVATRDGGLEPAEVLLRGAAGRARALGIPISVRKPDESVYAEALRRAGFVQVPRGEGSMMTMAHVFDPAGLARRVLAVTGGALAVEVVVWTPAREAVLNPNQGRSRRVILEMKEHDLARLLLCRLDLLEAVREERVTVVGTREDAEAVAQAFPFSPWDYQDLDYI